MTEGTERYCVNCRHFRPVIGINGGGCHHTANLGETDLVTGEQRPKMTPAALRALHIACGPIGVWYEARVIIIEEREPPAYPPSPWWRFWRP